jgi:hypothetical protein
MIEPAHESDERTLSRVVACVDLFCWRVVCEAPAMMSTVKRIAGYRPVIDQ